MSKLHRPKKNDTFTRGSGPWADTCDVIKVQGDTVTFQVRSSGEEGFFMLDSPTHKLARWWSSD